MAINYKALLGTVHKAKTGEVFMIEEYLGTSLHKYNIRFTKNGKVKSTSYKSIKSRSVTFTFRKQSKVAKKKKNVTAKKMQSIYNGETVFALDMASITSGYSVFKGTSYLLSGTISKSNKNKYIRINDMVNEIEFRIKKHGAKIIIIEDIFLLQRQEKSVMMYKTLANLQGALIDRLIKMGVRYHLVSASTWKSHFFKGKNDRNTGKALSLKYAKEMTGLDLNEDEAESFLIGLWYLSKHK